MNDTLNPPLRPPVIKPNLRFLLAHPAHFIALGAGSGLSPIVPGTAGTLFGWVSYLALERWVPAAAIGWVILAGMVIGVWACTVTAEHMRILDPGPIVWDEVVCFWLILWLVMPAGFVGQLMAFLVFRAFDTLKPGPIAWADGLFPGFGWRGGFGIMLDDVVAAFCTLLVIAAWRFW